MGMLRGLLKAGIAKKILNEAQKPQNQRKAREMFAKARAGRRGGRAR